MTTLPIYGVLRNIRAALDATQCCILEAAPGAGKTTVVPLELLNEPWLGGNRIVMLEPRRVSARAAARRMADTRGELVGDTIGYTIRNERKVSEQTRIEVVTEGVLARRITNDPELQGIGCVIFDEFHERSIHADAALALTLLSRDVFRSDLRIIVMSATLHALDHLATLVAGTRANDAIVRADGRLFPVETTYLNREAAKPLPNLMLAAVNDALASHDGDILCFLPGIGEIRQTIDALTRSGLDEHVDVVPLHSSVDATTQNNALAPTPVGRRKVIVSSSIAETSLTLPGVRTVIDSGFAREPRFDSRSGFSKLATVPVTLDSAEQRKGRAGRLGPGHCYRLWTEERHATLKPRRTPEILVTDLTPLLLDLSLFGVQPSDLSWLDAPPHHHVEYGLNVLRQIGAIDAHGHATDHGRHIAAFSTHPRLAHMIVAGRSRGLDAHVLANAVNDLEPDAIDARRIQSLSSRTVPPATIDQRSCAFALAYPDRVARRRTNDRWILANGRSATLAPSFHIHSEFLVATDIDATSGNAVIRQAEPLSKAEVEWLFADAVETRRQYGIDETEESVIARTQRMLGALVLDEWDDPLADEEAMARALAQWIVEREWRDLAWTEAATDLLHRMVFVHSLDAPVSPLQILSSALSIDVLASMLKGRRRLRDAQTIDVAAALSASMSYQDRASLEAHAPTHILLPSGRRVRVNYADPTKPVIADKLQHFFGLRTTPCVGNGRVPITIHLLSPAGRPIQVTQDLAGFWQGSYAQVRKEMRGRYPKHPWPEPEEL